MPVVMAPEEIDISNADWLRAALPEPAADGPAIVVVDMSTTQFCDSAGLHVLVRAHKRALAAGGELRLVVSSPTVVRLLAVTGIDTVIPQFRSVDEALGNAGPDQAAGAHRGGRA
jgi:anti-anti-sigma factor